MNNSFERYQMGEVEVGGMENLLKVEELNAEGKFVIFAPNHVEPNSVIRRNLALAEDFPKLKAVLENVGLEASVLFRGDGDMEIGDSKLKELIYDIHRRVFSALGKAYTGGIPLAINAKEPAKAMMRNLGNMREVFKTLKEKNLVIFPYGNWFPAREQTFEDLENGDFEKMENFEEWRKSVKSGFIRIAKKADAEIVPVYIDNTGGNWKIEFAEPMTVDKQTDTLEDGKKYLKQMKGMRDRNLLSG